MTLSNEELADHIAALDWSGTSLQHQLAMSAAITSLRGGQVPDLENPVGEMQGLLRDLLQQGRTGSVGAKDSGITC